MLACATPPALGILSSARTRITVLGEEAFLRNNDAACRPQDLADADRLRRAGAAEQVSQPHEKTGSYVGAFTVVVLKLERSISIVPSEL